jgi:ArsR family transcriptional regulator, arsenate/arsenite/antimonite-responsive transcriptional repressor
VKTLEMIDPACCVVGDAPLGERDAETLAERLRVLADPARLRLVSLISAEGEVCQCDLTRPLGLSQPTISHHLSVLTTAGVLEREKRGRWAFYRVRSEPLRALAESLTPSIA